MICDTSALLSALGADQRYHEECAAAVMTADRLVLAPLVLAELDYIVRARSTEQIAIETLRSLAGPEYELAQLESSDVQTAADVMDTYRDLRLGLTDASLIVLAKRYETHDILTLDQRHFRVVRSLEGRPFRLLPLDAL